MERTEHSGCLGSKEGLEPARRSSKAPSPLPNGEPATSRIYGLPLVRRLSSTIHTPGNRIRITRTNSFATHFHLTKYRAAAWIRLHRRYSTTIRSLTLLLETRTQMS